MLLLIRALLILTATLLVAGAIGWWLWRKQRRSRRAKAEQAGRQLRIDHLAELVAGGERDAQLAPDVAARLQRFVEALRAESQL